MSDFLNVTTNKAEVSDRHHGNRRRGVRYSIMAVWFCERHIDHNPNTPLSDFFQPYGVAPYAAGENRIGGHKNRSFLYGTVRPRVISECGNRTTQGLLLLKHALIRERSELRWALHPALFSTPNWGNSRAWLFWSRLRTVYYQSLWCRRQSMHVFASSAGAWLYAEVQQSDQELERALGLIHSTDWSGST